MTERRKYARRKAASVETDPAMTEEERRAQIVEEKHRRAEEARQARIAQRRAEAEARSAAEEEAKRAKMAAELKAGQQRQKAEAAAKARQEAEAREKAQALREKAIAKKKAELLAKKKAALIAARRQALEEARAQKAAEEQAKREEEARLAAERQAAEAEALRQQEAGRLAEEKRVAEEAARLEAQEREAEEAARLEQERLAAEEAARLAEEKRAAEEAALLEEAQAAARLEEAQAAEARAAEAAKMEAAIAAEEAALKDAEERLMAAKNRLMVLRSKRQAVERETAALTSEIQEIEALPEPDPQPRLVEVASPALITSAQAVDERWSAMGSFPVDEKHLDRQRIITAVRREPSHATFDVLRTRMLQALKEKGWSRVAITSPTKDCGKSFVSSNLALSLSRQDNCRTILLDLDLRKPSLARLFDVQEPGSIGAMLRGEISPEEHLRCMGKNQIHVGRKVAFGFNGEAESYASELLSDPTTALVLDDIEEMYEPDVMLFDMPPALYFDDVLAMRDKYDAVLLVVGGGVTTPKEIKEVEQRLGDSVPLLGTVLNKAENAEVEKYSY